MKMSSKVYDVLKWLILIVMPALITLIAALGKIYGWDTTAITATIAAATTFLGVITSISSAAYGKEADNANK